MILPTLAEFFAALPKHGRIMALDVGTKTVGMAVSDVLYTVATPTGTIRRKKFTSDLEELKKHIKEREVKGIVIGLPLNMDGSEGPKCQSVRQFGRNMLKDFDIPLFYWDERFSTQAAERKLKESDLSADARDDKVDTVAAAIILQGILDSRA